ncbi:MAG: PglZ domain-containing protein [Armatimonadota bacterium]|nr:PglZ domain-containing protein [bacterium]
MRISKFITRTLIDLLDERRIVVWYDAPGDFTDFASSFKAAKCKVVSAAESSLAARRAADDVYMKMNVSSDMAENSANLLIYVPRARETDLEKRPQDPFEQYAVIGTVFGDVEAHTLQSLARQAVPELTQQIDELFVNGRPTLAILDSLGAGRSYPLVREALDTESVVQAASLILCEDGAWDKVLDLPGAKEETLRLLKQDLGFEPVGASSDPDDPVKQLGQYVLLSEFAFDTADDLPDALKSVTIAGDSYRDRILDCCHRMRTNDGLKEGYVILASSLEQQLRLQDILSPDAKLGERDTFPFEERVFLRRLAELAQQGNLADVRNVLDARRGCIWKTLPERAQLWKVAERCMDLLQAAERIQSAPNGTKTLRGMVELYAAKGGWAELDRRQRLMENSAAECAEDSEVAQLLEVCRTAYRLSVERIQNRFQSQVLSDGWPADGILRQTQVFDSRVKPLLQAKEKVAYFLVDSLRYEMGFDLSGALSDLGEVDLTAASSVLPTATVFGMAALMPNADAGLRITNKDGKAVPAISETLLPDSASRMAYVRSIYGDRFREMTLGNVLSISPKTLEKQVSAADVLIVRSSVDDMAENLSLYDARKYMSGIIGDLRIASVRLSGMGYRHQVFTADHGHMLLPEIPAGDVINAPSGEWAATKRRCTIGQSHSSGDGVIVIPIERLGMQSDFEDIAFAAGYKTFVQGDGYFHEGLSLQECIVPVVSLNSTGSIAQQSREDIQLTYKRDTFTSKVIGLKATFSSLLTDSVRVRIEAYNGSEAKAAKVGETADCDARDDATKEVILTKNEETQVPVQIDADFNGDLVEIRAIDPATGAVWNRLVLKNGVID